MYGGLGSSRRRDLGAPLLRRDSVRRAVLDDFVSGFGRARGHASGLFGSSVLGIETEACHDATEFGVCDDERTPRTFVEVLQVDCCTRFDIGCAREAEPVQAHAESSRQSCHGGERRVDVAVVLDAEQLRRVDRGATRCLRTTQAEALPRLPEAYAEGRGRLRDARCAFGCAPLFLLPIHLHSTRSDTEFDRQIPHPLPPHDTSHPCRVLGSLRFNGRALCLGS